jgi:cathepsin L
VTLIKNQGQCGSCWVHTAAASIESAWAMKTGQIIDSSEQDLVNCVSSRGCNGETTNNANMFVIKSSISQESVLPYKASVSLSYTFKTIGWPYYVRAIFRRIKSKDTL